MQLRAGRCFPAAVLSRWIGGSDGRQQFGNYDIVVGEHSDFRIPFFAYRGTPTGIDVLKVVETGRTPVGVFCSSVPWRGAFP